MEVNEIFSALSAHFIKGLMIHDQLANYYDFLSLRGYKRCHEYHFKKESCSYRKLNRYYLNHYHKLIEEQRVDDPKVIPESWYKYTRSDVDSATKKNAVASGVQKWINWEKDTKETLERLYCELLDLNEIATAMFVKTFIKDVDCELKYAERKQLDLMAVDYDMTYIVGEQKAIHDKYKSML